MKSEDLTKRKILWSAFSDLWLDNEIQQYTLDSIALKMKQSDYSLTDLKYIYQQEVAPVVYQNLLSVAGVWDGFDEEWLHNEIKNNINKPNLWKKLWFYGHKSKMLFATKENWATLEKLFITEFNND